ncbi:hypothetical protein CKM354_001032200 [Cercospora kikuchii]|uniref:AB hydrolase-1 domain-containing protein n=1 Tax=Cercospora kikuchii TaxID=84275 RepID=A0A9P3CQR7_9PEZI|nr:uncharacterized protein CKM354_001032200 [Cercospora kikuchii]GIZ47224.1 hypothetical protein CKM354_001032200 [Cercospora kikuchii]
MSSFRVVEHVVRTQHSRERFAGADLDGEQHLRLHVKQYIPRSNLTPQPGDVTIIGGVAAAFPKECMEPLWQDLCEKLHERGRRVRAIWIADPVNQGQSGVLNEKLLGPDPSWWDHGRDLLFLINRFQDEMPHPLVGIAHSMGAGHLTHLALLHPRLLHALVLMDVVFSTETVGTNWAAASLKRRDLWPSRDAAESSISSSPVFKKFDSRVLAQYLRHSLRELPTEQYPDIEVANSTPGNDRPVTLQTTKAQEIYNCVRLTVPDDRYLLQDDDLLFENSHFENPQDSGAFNRSENLANQKYLHQDFELKD